MKAFLQSRRGFLKTAAISTGAVLVPRAPGFSPAETSNSLPDVAESKAADYTIRIRVSPIEIAPNRIISITNYDGQFPGPLIRLKEGQRNGKAAHRVRAAYGRTRLYRAAGSAAGRLVHAGEQGRLKLRTGQRCRTLSIAASTRRTRASATVGASCGARGRS